MSVTIESATLLHGDCLERMKELGDNSVDSVVTDPPYGLGFMGKKWDVGVPAADVFAECLRVLKPGGHLLAFGGSRTYHRLAVAVEDAGFEIRDQIMWVYGSGFPKSLNVGKAIDKAAGAEREDLGPHPNWRETNRANGQSMGAVPNEARITAPATDAARQWDGWGTALKPAHEPIVVARKPLAKGNTVAANVLEHGTGAINVDGCRVGTETIPRQIRGKPDPRWRTAVEGGVTDEHQGRWPANLIHDGSEEVVGLFPESTTGAMSGTYNGEGVNTGFKGRGKIKRQVKASSGSAARFFYQAKASKKDRGESNKHPTVKPTDLMRYLCRLVTPPGGTVLDPFMGSGSTGKAAVLEGVNFIGIELDAGYFEIAKQRITAAKQQGAFDL